MVPQEIMPSDDMVLVLDRKEAQVSLQGKVLRVKGKGLAPQTVPLKLLGLVVVYGNPSVSCSVWRALAEQGVAAVLLPAWGKGACCVLGSGFAVAVHLRMAQHRVANNAPGRRDLACHILEWKIRNQLALLDQAGLQMVAGTAPFKKKISNSHLKRIHADLASGIKRLPGTGERGLMGIEGNAAASWFSLLAKTLDPKWQFGERNRRPPKDPLNAWLSLGYTLLVAEMSRYIQRQGLDPAVGFLHTVVPGRDSLGLDLIEPLRPGVEALALELLATSLKPEHFFTRKEEGCRLNKDGRGLFYEAWSQWRADWPFFGATSKKEENENEPAQISLGQCCHRIVKTCSEHLRRLDCGAPSEEL